MKLWWITCPLYQVHEVFTYVSITKISGLAKTEHTKPRFPSNKCEIVASGSRRLSARCVTEGCVGVRSERCVFGLVRLSTLLVTIVLGNTRNKNDGLTCDSSVDGCCRNTHLFISRQGSGPGISTCQTLFHHFVYEQHLSWTSFKVILWGKKVFNQPPIVLP